MYERVRMYNIGVYMYISLPCPRNCYTTRTTENPTYSIVRGCTPLSSPHPHIPPPPLPRHPHIPPPSLPHIPPPSLPRYPHIPPPSLPHIPPPFLPRHPLIPPPFLPRHPHIPPLPCLPPCLPPRRPTPHPLQTRTPNHTASVQSPRERRGTRSDPRRSGLLRRQPCGSECGGWGSRHGSHSRHDGSSYGLRPLSKEK